MIKEYVARIFRLALTDEQEKKLIEYLLSKIDEISDIFSLRNLIMDFLMNTLNLYPRYNFSNDNSDLEQMLKIIKAKVDNK